MLGKLEDKRRREGGEKTKWIDGVIEATNKNVDLRALVQGDVYKRQEQEKIGGV